MIFKTILSIYRQADIRLKILACQLDKIPLAPKFDKQKKLFIFTEIINCGKIGKIAIESFVKFHPTSYLHVFGTTADLKLIKPAKNLILVDISGHKALHLAFRYGHFGTAMLWARLIRERPEPYIIHFDSDLIFRREALSDITKRFDEGYDLVGYIRNYKHNPNHREDVRHLPDVCQTAFFGFNTKKISKYSLPTLLRMCQGAYNPAGHPVIDFFDPVMFDILRNGGQLYLLDANDYGGCDQLGRRAKNNYSQINQLIDFGRKSIHFSAVGSGMNFYEHPRDTRGVPEGYRSYAIDKYALFCRLFYNEQINYPVNETIYQKISEAIEVNRV